MVYCPFYSKNCPRSDECEIWDTATETCGFKRQKSLLELINLKGEGSMPSLPPTGFHKIYNIYAKKIGEGKYNIMADIETEPEP